MAIGIRKVPPSVARLLDSTCVVSSPASVVKELLENALDAGAKTIEVRLESFGLSGIEVRDNGVGISPDDAPHAALCYYTSKLNSDNLSSVSTYGFRGVALSSVCQSGKLSIVTKNEGETVGRVYNYNHNGDVESRSIRAANRGTIVSVTDLFKNLPVRKQFYNNANKKKEVLRLVENILKVYAVILNDLRLSLYHDRKLVWQKSPSVDVRHSFLQMCQVDQKDQWEEINHKCPINSEINLMCILPKINSDIRVTSRSQSNVMFIFINKRPVRMKPIEQLVKRYYNIGHNLNGNQGRYPCCVVDLQIPTKTVDINVEPDKRTVYLDSEVENQVLVSLESILRDFYGLRVEDGKMEEVQCHPIASSGNSGTESETLTPLSESSQATIIETCNNENTDLLKQNEMSLEISPDDSVSPFKSYGVKKQVDELLNKDTEGEEPVQLENWSKGLICGRDGNTVEAATIFIGKRTTESLSNDGSEPKKHHKDVERLELEEEMVLEEPAQRLSNANANSFLKSLMPCQSSIPSSSKPSLSLKEKFSRNKAKLKNIGKNQRSLLDFGRSVRVEPKPVSNGKVVTFKMELLKSACTAEHRKRSNDDNVENDRIRLIGQLENGFWIVSQARMLAIANHHRLQETILFHKLMATHKVATHLLPIPEVIKESKLGQTSFSILLQLSTKKENEFVSTVVDDRVAKNGFFITVTEGHHDTVTVNVMGIANHIVSYSLDDLKECLDYIRSNSEITLYNCRPTKVKTYLKSEAIRMNSAHTFLMSRQSMEELLVNAEQWLPEDKRYSCLHDRPFYEPLHGEINMEWC